MFLSIEQIRDSLSQLESVHPIYGITFLACKLAELPIGERIHFPISDVETSFLDKYYKPYPQSSFFYRVFRTSDKRKHWVDRRKYASSTLQSIRTQTDFKEAFLHKKNTDLWGWRTDYVEVLTQNLSQNVPPYRNSKIPAFHLAVWLFRERQWPPESTGEDVIGRFVDEFLILASEHSFFDLTVPGNAQDVLFQEHVITSDDLREIIGPAPDAKPEQGGTLAFLHIQGVGPTRQLTFEPGPRLNLMTGDNGLGKTFLLECAWWALTGQWTEPSLQAYPRPDASKSEPKITIQIAGEKRKSEKTTIPYDWKTYSWNRSKKSPTIAGLVVYARVDGSFAVWDPARKEAPGTEKSSDVLPRSVVFTRSQVWGGQEGRIEGLLRDWVRWQSSPDQHPFEIFKGVLRRLSPPDLGLLEPGQPIRLPYEHREVPTLRHAYGEVAIVHASAGVRRIVTLAYLIVWAWNEHRVYSELARVEPQRRMVILIDEMEAHLHPQWQRTVLPALIDVRSELAQNLQVQFLVATHSPLVMASVESTFDDTEDKLFHLDLADDGKVSFKELRFIKYGAVDSWLTSEVFDLRYARSTDAEKAIEKAKELQKQSDPNPDDVRLVSEELARLLSSDDEFWPRWVYFAEQHGVEL